MSDNDDRVWFVKPANKDKPQGPYTHKDVEDLLQEGVLRPDDLCCQRGMQAWVPLSRAVVQDTSAADLLHPADRGTAFGRHIRLLAKILVVLFVVGGGYIAFKKGLVTRAITILKSGEEERAEETDPALAGLTGTDRKLKSEVMGLCKKASAATESEDFANALDYWQQVIDKGGANIHCAQEVAMAKQWQHWINLTENPDQRFSIVGSMGGAKVLLMIEDARDGTQHRVSPGESFLGFQLDSYNETGKSATISGGGKTYTIR